MCMYVSVGECVRVMYPSSNAGKTLANANAKVSMSAIEKF